MASPMLDKQSASWATWPAREFLTYLTFFPPADIQAHLQQTQFSHVHSPDQTKSLGSKSSSHDLVLIRDDITVCLFRFGGLALLTRTQGSLWPPKARVTLILFPRHTEYLAYPNVPWSTDPLYPLPDPSQTQCWVEEGVMDFPHTATQISSGSFSHTGTYQTMKLKLNWDRADHWYHQRGKSRAPPTK